MTATSYDPDVDPALQRRLDRVIADIEKLTAERDQLVIQAREGGASLREIAAHAGMTHVGVKKLLGRHLTPQLQADMDDELPDDEDERVALAKRGNTTYRCQVQQAGSGTCTWPTCGCGDA